MDMLLIYGLFHDFPNRKWGISGGVKVSGSVMKGSIFRSPLFEGVNLNQKMIYSIVFVMFWDIDDMSKGWDDVDVNTAAWMKVYPSGPTLFWNDMITTKIRFIPLILSLYL